MKATFEKKYHEIETTHFWFKARRKFILQLLEEAPKHISILDIGCSSGILLNNLRDNGFQADHLYGVDISEQAIENCKQNGLQNTYVMDAQNIELDKKFDVIIASDCLEHLEQDEKALANWHSLLKPNGVIYIFVPAFMALWSGHDVANMHYRRYTKTQLEKKVSKANFRIKRSSYWNFLLFLPIFSVRLLSKLNILKQGKADGDLEEPNLLNGVFYNSLNIENKALKHVSVPFGVSVSCIAEKKE